MKRPLKTNIIVLLLGMAFLAAMPSCNKDQAGVYSPKKKIQRIYGASSSTTKHLQSIWDWDGNLLESIDHYSSSGGLSWTESFTYDGKRLFRVDDYANAEYVLYEYDGNNLKSASYFYRNNIEAIATVTYSDKKISRITQTYYDSKNNDKASRHLNPLAALFPSHVYDALEKGMKDFETSRQGEGIYTIIWQFTWSDDNIVRLFGSTGNESMTVSFQYDSKNSVLKGFLDLYALVDDDLDSYVEAGCYSKNNVVKMICSYSDGDVDVLNLNYQYDKNDYPTMVTRSYDGSSYTSMTYYEYY